jgi:hypothetical protein
LPFAVGVLELPIFSQGSFPGMSSRSFRISSLLLALLCAGQFSAMAELQFVRTATGGRELRISFTNVSFPDCARNNVYDINPIINGDNLYAPDLVRNGDRWHCYYGGWKTLGQSYDRIYLGISTDLDPKGPWTEQMIISNGTYLHVNDPTVYREGSTWIMLYTAAKFVASGSGQRFRDWINYSTSADGITWTPNAGSSATEITISDPLNILGGSTLSDMARPSLVRDGNKWKLWFDAEINDASPTSYLAETTGTFPSNFQLVHKYSNLGSFPSFYEPDVVRRANGTFSAVIQRGFKKLHYGNSTDGINFTWSEAVDADHPFFARKWVSNPGLIYDDTTDKVLGLSFGMTDNDGFTDHDIGFSATHYVIEVRSPVSTWHIYSEAHALDELSAIVFGYTSFDQVRLKNPLTNQVLFTQDFTEARVGDTWRLVDTTTVGEWSLY